MRFYEFMPESEQLSEGPFGTLWKYGKKLYKGGKKVAKGTKKVGKAIANSPAAAKQFISSLGKKADFALYLFGTYELTQFVINYQDLVSQKELAQNGDTSTEYFGNTPSGKIDEVYNSTLEKMAGETVIATLPILLKAPAKLFKILGSIVSGAGGVAGGAMGGATMGVPGAMAGYAGGKMVGSLFGIPFKLTGSFMKMISGGVTGAAFAAFLQSEKAQEFFKTALQGQLIQMVGGVSTGLFNKASELLSSYFTDSTATTAAAAGSSTATKEPAATKSAEPAKSTLPPEFEKIEQQYNSYPLKVRFDRKNPKIMYVNNRPVTDENGLRYVNMQTLNDISLLAKQLKKPDPVANIPDNPRLPR